MVSPRRAATSPDPHSRPTVPDGHAEPLTLTHGAIGQLEARGAQALVGASRVLALASPAAAPEVFTLIHIYRVRRGARQPVAAPPRDRRQRGGLQRVCALPGESGPGGASSPCKAAQLGRGPPGAA